jgi:hypothetical protein
LAAKSPDLVDDNLLAVLKYNYSCCFNRFGMVEESIKALQEGIIVLRRKLDTINDKTNTSFIERSQTFSVDTHHISSNSGEEQTKEQSILSNQLHKERYLCKFHL